MKNYLKELIRTDGMMLPLAFSLYKRLKRHYRRHLELIPLVWMDQSNAESKGILQKGGEFFSHGPYFVKGDKQTVVKARTPDLYYRVFRNGRISAVSSSIVLNDEEILVERVGNETKAFDYAAGHILMHGPSSAIVRIGGADKLEKGLFFAGNGSYNYYHWLIEIAAKSEFLSSLPECYQNYPILLSEDVAAIPSFTTICEKLLPGRELVYLEKNKSYLVDKLVWIDTPNNLPFNLFGKQQLKAESFHIRSDSIKYLRHQFLGGMACDASKQTYPKRIFLGRRSKTRGYNHQEIEACISKYGFSHVALEELSFEEQVATINNAEYIIGPTGAAWTNLIFCQPGTKCVCWMAEEYGDFSAFSNIAEIVGAELYYLTGKTGEKRTTKIFLSKYRLSPDELDALLQGDFFESTTSALL